MILEIPAANPGSYFYRSGKRDKVGEGPLPATTNAIIDTLSDTGDFSIVSADYAADGVLALTAWR
jgi:hypothetical protein